MKPLKNIIALSAVLLAVVMLCLIVTVPANAQNTGPFSVDETLDKALNALELPAPTPVHFPSPVVIRRPLTGQPYEQQPFAAQDDFLTPGGRR